MAARFPSKDLIRKFSDSRLPNATPWQSPTLHGLPYDARLRSYKATLVSDLEITLEVHKNVVHKSSTRNGPKPKILEWIRQLVVETYDTTPHHPGGLVLDPSINFRLLRTCKTVYEEALPVFYSQKIFAFNGRATTNSDLDRLISGHARDHLAFVRLHVNDCYLAQIFQPPGPNGHIDTLWLGLCNEIAGIRRTCLSFVPRDTKNIREMSDKFVKFMTHIALHMDHGCRTDLLPKVVAKVVVSKVGDNTGQVIPMEIPYQRERRRHETLYTPTPVPRSSSMRF